MDSEWTLSGLESSTVQPLLERLSSGTHLREKSSRTFQETAIAVLERSHIHNEPTYDEYNHAHRYAHRVGPRTAATSPCSALSRRMMDGRRLISPQSTQMEDRYDTVSCKSMNEEISDDCAVNDPQTSRPTRERDWRDWQPRRFFSRPVPTGHFYFTLLITFSSSYCRLDRAECRL